MGTARHLLPLVASGLLAGCASLPFARHDWSPEAARAQAARDLAAGRPRICWSGTIGDAPLGVQGFQEQTIAARLPAWHLPSGCTDPQVEPAMRFGLVYNREVLTRLSVPGWKPNPALERTSQGEARRF